MKHILIVFLCVLCVSALNCAINYKPTIQQNPVDEKINKITLSGFAEPISNSEGYIITLSGSGEVEHTKCDKEPAPVKKFNPFHWEDIKETIGRIFTIIWNWLLAIIFIIVSICALTEIIRRAIKSAVSTNPVVMFLKIIPSFAWTILLGAVSYVIFAIAMKSDMECNLVLQIFCVISANVIWEFGINKFGKKVAVPSVKYIAKNIILKNI